MRSLKRMHCKRHLVPSGKQVAYQLPRTQGSLSSLKRVPRPLHTQDSTCRDGQQHSGVIHKQGRRHEVGPTLCFTMENLDLVHQKSSISQSPTHSRPAECGHSQAIQARPDHPNRVVSPSGGLPSNMQQVTFEVQGFSEAVAARIETPQRGSTRSVYEAKWTIFTSGASLIRWTSGYPCKISC